LLFGKSALRNVFNAGREYDHLLPQLPDLFPGPIELLYETRDKERVARKENPDKRAAYGLSPQWNHHDHPFQPDTGTVARNEYLIPAVVAGMNVLEI
jgi:hypothetical protein